MQRKLFKTTLTFIISICLFGLEAISLAQTNPARPDSRFWVDLPGNFRVLIADHMELGGEDFSLSGFSLVDPRGQKFNFIVSDDPGLLTLCRAFNAQNYAGQAEVIAHYHITFIGERPAPLRPRAQGYPVLGDSIDIVSAEGIHALGRWRYVQPTQVSCQRTYLNSKKLLVR